MLTSRLLLRNCGLFRTVVSSRSVLCSTKLCESFKDMNSNFKTMSDVEWRQKLTPVEYEVCRQGETEPPFSGEYNAMFAAGIYACVCCGSELFSSETKFNSGCGWPSFYDPLSNAVQEKKDLSQGMIRTEVCCSKCESHLGHVFDDGPPPTGRRYCINSVCLEFTRENSGAT